MRRSGKVPVGTAPLSMPGETRVSARHASRTQDIYNSGKFRGTNNQELTATAILQAVQQENHGQAVSNVNLLPSGQSDLGQLLGVNMQQQEQLEEVMRVNDLLRLDLAVSRNQRVHDDKLALEKQLQYIELGYKDRGIQLDEQHRQQQDKEEFQNTIKLERISQDGLLRSQREVFESKLDASGRSNEALRQEQDSVKKKLNVYENMEKRGGFLMDHDSDMNSVGNSKKFAEQQGKYETQKDKYESLQTDRDDILKTHAQCGVNIQELQSLRKDISGARQQFLEHEEQQQKYEQICCDLQGNRQLCRKLENTLLERQMLQSEWETRLMDEQMKHAHCGDKLADLATKIGLLERDKKELQKVLLEERSVIREKTEKVEESKKVQEIEVESIQQRIEVAATQNDYQKLENTTLKQQLNVIKQDGDGRIGRNLRLVKENTEYKSKLSEEKIRYTDLEATLASERLKHEDTAQSKKLLDLEIAKQAKQQEELASELKKKDNQMYLVQQELNKSRNECEKLNIKQDMSVKSSAAQREALENNEDKIGQLLDVRSQLQEQKDRYMQLEVRFDSTHSDWKQLEKKHVLVNEEYSSSVLRTEQLTLKLKFAENRVKLLEVSLNEQQGEHASLKTDYLRVFSEVMKKEKLVLKEQLINVDVNQTNIHLKKTLDACEKDRRLVCDSLMEAQERLTSLERLFDARKEAHQYCVFLTHCLATVGEVIILDAPGEVVAERLLKAAQRLQIVREQPDQSTLEWPSSWNPLTNTNAPNLFRRGSQPLNLQSGAVMSKPTASDDDIVQQATFMKKLFGVVSRGLNMAGDALLQKHQVYEQQRTVVLDYQELGTMYNKAPKQDLRQPLTNIQKELKLTNRQLTSVVALDASDAKDNDAQEYVHIAQQHLDVVQKECLQVIKTMRLSLEPVGQTKHRGYVPKNHRIDESGLISVETSTKQGAEFILETSPLSNLNIEINILAGVLEQGFTSIAVLAGCLRTIRTAVQTETGEKCAKMCHAAVRQIGRVSGNVLIHSISREIVDIAKYCRDTNRMVTHVSNAVRQLATALVREEKDDKTIHVLTQELLAFGQYPHQGTNLLGLITDLVNIVETKIFPAKTQVEGSIPSTRATTPAQSTANLSRTHSARASTPLSRVGTQSMPTLSEHLVPSRSQTPRSQIENTKQTTSTLFMEQSIDEEAE